MGLLDFLDGKNRLELRYNRVASAGASAQFLGPVEDDNHHFGADVTISKSIHGPGFLISDPAFELRGM